MIKSTSTIERNDGENNKSHLHKHTQRHSFKHCSLCFFISKRAAWAWGCGDGQNQEGERLKEEQEDSGKWEVAWVEKGKIANCCRWIAIECYLQMILLTSVAILYLCESSEPAGQDKQSDIQTTSLSSAALIFTAGIRFFKHHTRRATAKTRILWSTTKSLVSFLAFDITNRMETTHIKIIQVNPHAVEDETEEVW